MDFDSLMRRDLQFLCKRNKIPANMTNLAMADGLKALEIVEGLDEYMNQSDSNPTPTPNTATRTTRRKTTVKAEPQSSVQSVYSTRRSTRLLEKCMGDLSLKTNETSDNEAGRDLSASMEKEWKMLKNEVDGNVEKESDKQEEEETLQQAMCEEEGLKKNDNISNIEVYVDLGDIPVLEHANTETNNDNKESKNVLAFESLGQVDQQETEQAIQKNDSEAEKINILDKNTIMDQTDCDEQKEGNFGVESDGTISEADSNQAVLGSDIADEEMILSESETKVKTTPFEAESISVQFPRPSKSTTTPLKVINVDNENKENNMEMMMNVVNNNENGESKVEAKKKMKKVVAIDEENLKDVSMRQLVKMVKELSIKSSNRTALQILPGNNQIAE